MTGTSRRRRYRSREPATSRHDHRTTHNAPGQPLEIQASDGRLEIEIAATAMQLTKRGKGVVAIPETPLPKLTAEEVRSTLERVRR